MLTIGNLEEKEPAISTFIDWEYLVNDSSVDISEIQMLKAIRIVLLDTLNRCNIHYSRFLCKICNWEVDVSNWVQQIYKQSNNCTREGNTGATSRNR